MVCMDLFGDTERDNMPKHTRITPDNNMFMPFAVHSTYLMKIINEHMTNEQPVRKQIGLDDDALARASPMQ
jgi:hypothetical protein